MSWWTNAQEQGLSARVMALKEEVADLRSELQKKARESHLTDELIGLREGIETLKIEKGRLEEENAKKLREVTHQVGLERKRQEFEIEAAKRDALLTVREENLSADRDRFEAQMKFEHERFEQEVGYLKGLMESILDRLPTVTVDRVIGASNGHREKVAP